MNEKVTEVEQSRIPHPVQWLSGLSTRELSLPCVRADDDDDDAQRRPRRAIEKCKTKAVLLDPSNIFCGSVHAVVHRRGR